jgi:hypothetical protein
VTGISLADAQRGGGLRIASGLAKARKLSSRLSVALEFSFLQSVSIALSSETHLLSFFVSFEDTFLKVFQ